MRYFILFLILLNTALGQTIYNIPWASVQPQFVFPIYLENGQGERDTLYIGYDPAASGYGVVDYDSDAVFGVKRQKIDTNSFYACWATTLYINGSQSQLRDSVHKANVSNLSSFNNFPLLTTIYVHGGTLPIKLSWDITALWSDSLPYGHPDTVPEAQGKFTFYYSGDERMRENGQQIICIHDLLLITDSVSLAVCSVKDSVTLYNRFGFPVPTHWGFFDFSLEEWTGILTGLTDPQPRNTLTYPNPFDSDLTITGLTPSDTYFVIVDLLGNVQYKSSIARRETIQLQLGSLPKGIFILKIFGQQTIRSELLLKN